MLTFIAATLLHVGGSDTSAWELINEEDGVQVFSRDVPGSDLVAFRGITIMEATLEDLVRILTNNEHRRDWVDRLYISETLQTNSDFDFVLYQAFGLPIIMSDRDYVYRGQIIRDATGAIVLKLQSVEHADAPQSVGVRAHLHNSLYVLTPMPGGKVMVDVEIHTDPKGWIPTWVVNMIQESWPVKTLNGMRAQLTAGWVTPHALPEAPPSSSTTVAPPR